MNIIYSSLLFLSIVSWLPCPSSADPHVYTERHYQHIWCSAQNGIEEYVLDDKTRVDCLTEEYAVEVEFAPKWAEAVGQALYYALKTGKKPGIDAGCKKTHGGIGGYSNEEISIARAGNFLLVNHAWGYMGEDGDAGENLLLLDPDDGEIYEKYMRMLTTSKEELGEMPTLR